MPMNLVPLKNGLCLQGVYIMPNPCWGGGQKWPLREKNKNEGAAKKGESEKEKIASNRVKMPQNRIFLGLNFFF